jgi:nucleoid-associated protein YgaU
MQRALQRRAVIMTGVVVSLLLICTMTSFAQNLGDVARQERERKKDQPQRETHVYTNDDLDKERILVPEDQARALTARTWIEPPATQEAQASAAPAPVPPGAIRVPPSPAAVKPSPASPKPVLMVSSPALPDAPAANSPIRVDRSDSQPLQLTRPAPRKVLFPVLVSSPSGWKTVRVETAAKKEFSRPDVATPNPVRASLRKPEPDTSETNRVRVERGDSLWKLAERHLGSGALWRELAELNPQLSNPNLIRAGAWIHLPAQEPRNAKHIVIRSGDTLWSVAHAEFGSGLAFSCIAGANPQLRSVDRIRPGDTLALPETCAIAR